MAVYALGVFSGNKLLEDTSQRREEVAVYDPDVTATQAQDIPGEGDDIPGIHTLDKAGWLDLSGSRLAGLSLGRDMATVLPSTAISPCVACQIRHVIDLPLFCGKPSRVVIDPEPSLLPSPLELAKHGDCPSKTDATIDDNFARLASVAFFGHRSDPRLPKYALKGDHEKKSHAMNVDWEIA